MKMKRGLLLLAAAIVISGTGAFAQMPGRGGGPGGMGMRRGMGMDMQGQTPMKDVMELYMIGRFVDDSDFQKKAGISSTQANDIKALVKSADDAMKSNNDKLKTLGDSLTRLLNTTTPDTAKLDAKMDEISAVQAANNKEMLHAALKIKAVLTIAQIQKAKEYFTKSQQERQRGGGRGSWDDGSQSRGSDRW